jgi:uncharacterized protein YbjT (DUF2867 family)
MSTSQSDLPVLVIGATGKQGGAAARELLAAGVPVRALVRDPESDKAREIAELGAELVVGDLYDKDSLVEPCTGVRAVFGVFAPDMANLAADNERVHSENLVAAAVEAGVPHFIHSSVSGAGEHHRNAPGWKEGRWSQVVMEGVPPFSEYWEAKATVVELVKAAGFPSWTIIYPSTFMEMFLRPSFYYENRTGDQLRMALTPDVEISLVAVRDIGRAVAAAVVDPEKFKNADVELAGAFVTMAELADTLGAAWSSPIKPPNFTAEQALEAGLVPPLVNAGEWQRIVGSPARPEHAAAFGIPTTSLDEWARSVAQGA